MARELSRSERRLAVLMVFVLFWGAFLVALGVAAPLVAVVLGDLRVLRDQDRIPGHRARRLLPRTRLVVERLGGAGRSVGGGLFGNVRFFRARQTRAEGSSGGARKSTIDDPNAST